jgi:uncharacterized damage-inducible protein DinB
MSLVEEAVKNWESQRAGVIAEVENTPDHHLDYRTGSDARTFREIATHIARSSVGFVDQILKADGSFMNLFNPDVIERLQASVPDAAAKAELIQLLKSTGEQNAARLREAGDRLLSETIPTVRGVQTRLSAVWFAVGHEMYHRGQLAICERGFGTEPALTRQLNAMLAAR